MHTTCRQNPDHHFEITDEDLAFYAKMDVPPPTLCPLCRMRRRMSLRHGGQLYDRRCDLTGKEIIAMYPPEAPFPVYEQTEWWGDGWDGLSYGQDIDWNRTFSVQFRELLMKVPHTSLLSTNGQNCAYTNHLLNAKNCYLIVGGSYDEDCYYGHFVNRSRSCLDSLSINNCERCYEGVASSDCTSCAYFLDCRSCFDCIMVEDCQSCHDCIGCFGLRNKSYSVFNEYVGKERYEQMKRSLLPLTSVNVDKLRTRLAQLKAGLPHRYAQVYNCEDSSGDMLFSSRNCHFAFDSREGQDSKFLCFTPKAIDSYDCTFNAPDGVELCYEALSTVGVTGGIVTNVVWSGSNVLYSQECHNCNDLFGCVGLKRQKYCIFNKQYTAEEYARLLPRIKQWMREQGQWGEFFDSSLSLFPYNDSIAQDYFPMTEDTAREAGLRWRMDTRTSAYHGTPTALPDRVIEADEGITRSILSCEVCGKNYKIITQEFRFCRELGLPLPRACFGCRHQARLRSRNPRMLYDRSCGKCSGHIQTTYAPDRPEMVYCERCYQETVY